LSDAGSDQIAHPHAAATFTIMPRKSKIRMRSVQRFMLDAFYVGN